MVVGVVGLVAGALMWAWNPQGGPDLCPLKAATGWDCPFCGGLRGTHDLLHGQFGAALNQNLLLPLYLGAMMLLAGMVVVGEVRGRPVRWRPRRSAVWASVAVMVVFTVVRNLPGVPFLPSGTG